VVSGRKEKQERKAKQRLTDSRDEGRGSESESEGDINENEGADNEGSGTIAGTPGSSKRASALKEVRSFGGERGEVGAHNVGSGTSAS
jgi:hypothetical protein